jgi:multiple sugar transport system substrate-binding protein
MWVQFAELWHGVNPNSTSFDFMQQPLLSGEVWIAFDHVARVLSALREKPEDFVVFPAPAGPKGRGYMPVLAGLAMLRKAPHKEGAAALIDYLSQAQTQIAITRAVGFVPVVKAELPEDLEPGLKMAATALGKMQSAQDALPALPPTGLGHRADEFDRVLMDTFQFIVLRGQNPRMVLDREADVLTRLMTETGASCWQPDLPSAGACQVQ